MKQKFASRLLSACIVAVAVTAPAFAVQAEEELICKATIESVLDKYEIDRSTIKKMYIINQYEGQGRSSSGFIAARNGWVDFNTCKGSLVVKMSLECDVEEIYTRYGCEIPGLKNY